MSYNYNAYPWGRWIKWAVLGLIAVILLITLGGNYNGLVTADQNVKSKWSQVENVMQARADKITNLVEVVKGYVKHEEKVFGDVAAARSVLMNGSSGDESIPEKLKADEKLSSATRGILMLVENYPALKADVQFTNLQTAIEGAENRVSVERKRFIEAVENYNTKVSRFPGNLFAKVLGFSEKDYFKADSNAKESPKVEF